MAKKATAGKKSTPTADAGEDAAAAARRARALEVRRNAVARRHAGKVRDRGERTDDLKS